MKDLNQKTYRFKVGDRVRTLPVQSYSEVANELYANKDAIVTAVLFPFGLHMQYEVTYDEPFYDHGYLCRKHCFYDFDNALALREADAKKFHEVAITDKATGEIIDNLKDVEKVLRVENLITGEIVTKITRRGNRTFKYDNREYDIRIIDK